MKHYKYLIFLLSVFQAAIPGQSMFAQSRPTLVDKTNPWTSKQLIEPAQLAAVLNNPKLKKPLIFNIGVVQDIKGAKNVGAASDKANLVKLKSSIAKLPRNSNIVVYCGCCPFEKCPNVRPAFQMVKDMGFSNARLLNLSTNIKTDWISKDYPMAN